MIADYIVLPLTRKAVIHLFHKVGCWI